MRARPFLKITVSCSLSTESAAMKLVLVTGGNKGIGKAICQLLLEKHPDVHVLLGSRDLGRGKKAIEDLREAVGSSCDGRLDLVELDTSSSESVDRAAATVSKVGGSLYGIVNNAGIGFGSTVEATVNTNYFGVRRVNDAFGKLLQKPGGRIVNVASASGPQFLSQCSDAVLYKKLAEPLTISGGVAELDEIAKTTEATDAYGFSKALLNAYTVIHANSEPDLVINSCTPGWIATDLTAGSESPNPPSKGAIPPVHLLMSIELGQVPTGRYYGSDCVRSPMNVYRNPGDPPYEGP
jgi:NAD(P)-dependent dehydrogenase (short-subunit alcohol dehydrogenase family)